VTLPLMRPSVVAVFLLALIRALESFEVPLLIGAPGNLHTLTTAIYESIHTGFVPKYGEASAFAVLLLGLVTIPLAYYYWLTKEVSRFATITGKGFRPRRLRLGRWRLPLGLWLLAIPLSLIAPLLILLWASFLPVYKPPELADFGRMSLANYQAVWGPARDANRPYQQRAHRVLEFDRGGRAHFRGRLAGHPSAQQVALRARCADLGAAGLSRHRARDHHPDRVPAAALHSDLRHDLDSGVRFSDPVHALRHAVLPRRHPGDPS
jgi:hypothetical protein